jgi:ankyrin repeat protein
MQRRHVLLFGPGLLIGSGPARADDGDPALGALRRPAAPAAATRRGPPAAPEWERALRGADRLGPTPLRDLDLRLLAALRQGRWDESLALVRQGGAVNARDERGGAPLVLAAAAGQEVLLRELLQRGADPDLVGEGGFTALTAAAFAGRRGSVALLLRAGADPARWATSGQTALHLAALAGRIDVIEEMLKRGVNLELLNRARESALDVAAAAERQDTMDRLIDAGADLQRAGRR